MLQEFRDKIISFLKSRLFVLGVILFILFCILTHRLFVLQIIKGESYLDNFTLKIEREKTIKSTRGTIFDRNGRVLAEDKLAYSVTIEDNYDSGSRKNMELNDTIRRLIGILEQHGDRLNSDFNIILDSDNRYAFALSGRRQLRFLADIYGHISTDDLLEKERSATAKDVIDYLCSSKKFGIGSYREAEDGSLDFIPEEGYSKEDILKLITVRYNLNLNSFQKYIATTVATNVNEGTVAEIMENKDNLQGVDIAEDTIRSYIDDPSFSHILGYTGRISEEELTELNQEGETASEISQYELNDVVGKAGIEQVMERRLQGRKGRQTIFVDNLGRVTETGDRTDPIAGNNLYLTIDSDLQKAIYQILEQKIAGVVISKIRDIKRSTLSNETKSSDIIISIDDVYFALFDNNFINMRHLASDQAGVHEKQVYQAYLTRLETVLDRLGDTILNGQVPYKDESREMQTYETYIVTMLQSDEVNVFDRTKVDPANEVYINWKAGEVSLQDYLREAISEGWIDTSRIQSNDDYLDSDEIFSALRDYSLSALREDSGFAKKIYQYLIQDEGITGVQICHIPYEQGKLVDSGNALGDLDSGNKSAYRFMLDRIRNLDITPADLALDPCTGSCVVTDVNTGEVLACVSYPSYDNHRFANNVDAEYYASLRNNKALPLFNYATQQKTAPGSTFKPVSSTAGLEEHVLGQWEEIDCVGHFDKIGNPEPKCWVYPHSTHGNLNIIGAIQNSCNFFFYEVGFRLSLDNGRYDSDKGVSRLSTYADLYGLSEKSGIEITESEPEVSSQDAVRSAIGQANHNYTTVGLARYCTTVANQGVCYKLSLLDKCTDSNGNLLEDFTPEVRNNVQIASTSWYSIHEGMRQAVEHYGAFEDFPITAGGKTGTAQESESRPNHALFIGYAPFNKPEISIATRIAYGYTSSNAAEVSRDVFKYYFKLEDKDDILTGTATLPDSAAIGD
ncbi:MAG: penicillin-binding protein [Lachnospiraceae bacterium]|nr:penicillin-binding protein [Lachnospiraceae bacterium]